MQGAFSLVFLNKSRTREAPKPTNISTNTELDIEKYGTPASPAITLANRVFPILKGPTRRTPLGMRAPNTVNLSSFFRNSTTSIKSSLSSSTPITSSNVTPVFRSITFK
ncbi:hypothetical protein V8G54_012821 [Vigna mungo]|uniref:Uncharacterized protein n=1 Tax=Vigna mungo TaxID=3915 RepID=A0AAQ3NRW8_VIGMU